VWTRSELKENAKGKLKGFYWQAFLVSFILVITGGSHNRLDLGSSGSSTGTTSGGSEFALEIALFAVVGFLIFLALRIFLGYILEVGGRKYFIQYILAEDPGLDHNRALNLSREMTAGQKLDIFILDLSFLGWFFLGALFFGIGILFVQPYYDATNAELYQKVKARA